MSVFTHNATSKQRSDTRTAGRPALIDEATVPLALYIHIPWCVKKCPYCDFNSHELPLVAQEADGLSASAFDSVPTEVIHDKNSLSKSALFADYVQTLLLDASSQQVLAQGRTISSIFIGGGTPSLLPIAQYQQLFAGLRERFVFADDIEITMEANPGTLEHAPFAEYLAVGINRLSIGVQSFAADKLTALGRIHNPDQALSAIQAARAAGFKRVNVDLMHGLPQQSLEEAVYDIQTAHNAGATHISWYQLTIEPNTVFYRSQPILPDEDNLADIEHAGQALLKELGYRNYEVSAWAGAADTPCRHNMNYWQFGDYLAIGAGAHGKITLTEKLSCHDVEKLGDDNMKRSDGIYRFSKSRLPKDYRVVNKSAQPNSENIDAPRMINWQRVADDELVSEFMLNALRLHDGISWQLFEERTGLSRNHIAKQVRMLIEQGLLEDSTYKLQPTTLGQRYLNQILQAFL